MINRNRMKWVQNSSSCDITIAIATASVNGSMQSNVTSTCDDRYRSVGTSPYIVTNEIIRFYCTKE